MEVRWMHLSKWLKPSIAVSSIETALVDPQTGAVTRGNTAHASLELQWSLRASTEYVPRPAAQGRTVCNSAGTLSSGICVTVRGCHISSDGISNQTKCNSTGCLISRHQREI
ncbi:hypothetical protein V8C42DRAFT_307327 [Trichoderma barbatum]